MKPHFLHQAEAVSDDSPVGAGDAQSIWGLVAAAVLFVLCLVHFLTSVKIGWRHTICDAHGFRQSQTAISADCMLRGGPWLIYETPVLGPPWTIPFEFPLYQWIVAVVASMTGSALDPVGRLVSVAFFLLTLWPSERLLAALRVSQPSRLLILALLVSSPFYIFWSRTFLIESTALFLAISSLACTVSAIRRPSAGRLVPMAVVGSLAAVVKITTFFPFLIASMVLLGYQIQQWGRKQNGPGWARQWLLIVAYALLPALALITWTYIADHAKARSILGKRITSTNLQAWNFGTLKQRLSAETWSVLLNRTELPLGRKIPFALAALGMVMARRRFAEVAVCLLLYTLGILTFNNLFYIHVYYYFANNVFLIVAVGMAIVAMIEAGRHLKSLAIVGLVLLLGSMVFDYTQTYQPIQAHNETTMQRLASVIRAHTMPDDVIVLLGFDWSAEVPYYSGRRALCLVDWADPTEAAQCLMALTPYRVGAVVSLPSAQRPMPCPIVLALLREHGFQPEPYPVDVPFELLLRRDPTDQRGHAACQ